MRIIVNLLEYMKGVCVCIDADNNAIEQFVRSQIAAHSVVLLHWYVLRVVYFV